MKHSEIHFLIWSYVILGTSLTCTEKILCLMVENSSGKEKKSKLTSFKIRQAKNFQPSGREFLFYTSI
ncbi:Uncharacterised protein [Porphyromonas macacae]|uniref:Uncharacterized protein n=1 Tax=Porphyromonas macacae TaxID=28115 RepID=A0A379E8X3_9PORP|nr:Uncharacterised protein [Porphyromonas macacae]